jgi:GNAT superfamily N-acetyltransferase
MAHGNKSSRKRWKTPVSQSTGKRPAPDAQATTKDDRKAYDLSEATNQFDKLGLHPDLIKAVRKFHAIESVKLDLNTALDSVALMLAMEGTMETASLRICNALLMHAVVTYARATHTKAIERYNVGITGAYDRKLNDDHDRVIRLRDKCLAHFGPGDNRWHDERVVMIEDHEHSGVMAVHRRMNIDYEVVEALRRLLEAAIPYAMKLEVARGDDLGQMVRELPPKAQAEVRALAFDTAKFFEHTPGAEEKFWQDAGFSEGVLIR